MVLNTCKPRQTEVPHTAADLATLLMKVCEAYQIDPTTLHAKSKRPCITEPRGVMVFLMRELYRVKWERIGSTFGVTKRRLQLLAERTHHRFEVDRHFRKSVYQIISAINNRQEP